MAQTDLATIISSLAPGANADDPLALVLSQVLDNTRARSAAVYLLDLRTSSLTMTLSAGDAPSPPWPERVSPDQVEQPTVGASHLSVPVRRGDNLVGLIEARGRPDGAFTERDLSLIQALGGTASVVYSQQYLLQLITEAQTPVDYTQDEADFYLDLEQIIKRASQTPAGALREIDGDVLRPVISWGTGDADLEVHIPDVAEFAETLEQSRPVVLTQLNPSSLAGLLAAPPLDRIRTAVLVPVLVGLRKWGVISFGLHLPYTFSEPELAGLEMIANGVGVSIENFRNYRRAELERQEFREASAALTANDLVQMARHETRDLIGGSQGEVVVLRRKLRDAKLPQSSLAHMTGSLSQIDQNLTDIMTVLDRMKVASEPPSDELKLVPVRDLWTDVIAHVERSMRRLDIVQRPPQLNPSLYVYRDWFRHALLNLVLNSIEAYRLRRRSGEIGLVVELKPQAGVVELTYYDHAGGLDRTFYRTAREYRDRTDLARLIFEPRVTSKQGGSGFGLYFVQRIVSQDHQGSIELIDDKPGATFRITMPLDLHERLGIAE